MSGVGVRGRVEAVVKVEAQAHLLRASHKAPGLHGEEGVAVHDRQSASLRHHVSGLPRLANCPVGPEGVFQLSIEAGTA
eukprot:517476-Alexandrium_andersonii.AAC.1